MNNQTVLDLLIQDNQSPPKVENLIESQGIELDKSAALDTEIVGQLEFLSEKNIALARKKKTTTIVSVSPWLMN